MSFRSRAPNEESSEDVRVARRERPAGGPHALEAPFSEYATGGISAEAWTRRQRGRSAGQGSCCGAIRRGGFARGRDHPRYTTRGIFRETVRIGRPSPRSGPLVALADQIDPKRPDVERILRSERGGLVLPAPAAAAAADYLIATRIGPDSERLFLDDLAAGAFKLECLDPDELSVVAELAGRYADLRPGLADPSIVALARRFGTRRILTFDERHFRAMRPLRGGAFKVLPADG